MTFPVQQIKIPLLLNRPGSNIKDYLIFFVLYIYFLIYKSRFKIQKLAKKKLLPNFFWLKSYS